MRTEREQGEEPGAVARTLAGVACLCSRYPAIVLLATLVSVGLSLCHAATRLTYQTQRSDLVSPQKDYYQRWRQYLAEFGDDDDMVVAVKGSDRAAMIRALDELAAEVSRQPEQFDRLFYRVDLRHLQNRALLFLPADQIRSIQDNLQSMSLLLEPPVLAGLDPLFGWKSLTLLQLLNEADRRLGPWRNGRGIQAGDEQFLRQLEAICRSAAVTLDDPSAYRNPWRSVLPESSGQHNLLAEPQYFFSGDGSLAFLLVRPLKEKEGFTFAQKSIEALRGIIARVEPRFPNLKMGLTGLPVLENDEMVATQSDSQFASWLALAGVALLYLIVYRGIRYPLFTVATLLVGTAWALGWLTLTVGHLNILSSAFAVMLIGMGDYGVLWVSRYAQERRAGAELASAMGQTALSVGPGILTAATTTAFAFYAAMLADFKAVAELGWIAGSGILLCAVSCFTVMPALLALFDFRQATNEGQTEAILNLAERRAERSPWLPALARRPRLVVAASVVVVLSLGFLATRVDYDHNLLRLQAGSLDSVQWEKTLIRHTAGESWHALSYTNTPEEALELKARYEKLPGVSRVVEVASLVPRDQEHKLEVLGDIQYRLRRLPERHAEIAHALPRLADLDRALGRVREVLRSVDTAKDLPVICTLAGALKELQDRVAPAALEKDSTRELCARRLQTFQQRMTRDLADDLHKLRDISTPALISLADLPANLRERYIGRTGKWLLRVFGKECLWEYGHLKDFVKQIVTVDAEATGRPFSTLEGLRAMKRGFLCAGFYAMAAMVLVLLLDFRSFKHTFLALAPLAMGLVVSLGILALCGLPLNPANMIAFPLILGVGVDNGVHVLHDYLSRRRDASYTLGHATGRGIMVAALTTILGFGTLMISRHRGLASLGLILTLGVTCCMLAALVFLPAVLRMSSLRRLNKENSQRARTAA